jgi:hypothetical protein
MRFSSPFLSIGLVMLLLSSVSAAEYGIFAPSEFSKEKRQVVLVPWNSAIGKSRFASAAYKEDFFQLAQTYQPQINPVYCGVASSVIVLNALRLQKGGTPSQAQLEVQAPPALGGKRLPFPSYSQLTFLNEETEPVKPRQLVELRNVTKDNENDKAAFDPGLTLAQLEGLLKVYKAHVQLEYAADENVERGTRSFRKILKRVLSEPNRFLIVNFKGTAMGAPTAGHITPVGAYDRHSDSVLLLDVASHRNPWYWVPVRHLYQAMHTRDGVRYRGYLVVSDGD